MKEWLASEGAGEEGLEEAARDQLQRWKVDGEIFMGFDEFVEEKGGWDAIKKTSMIQEDMQAHIFNAGGFGNDFFNDVFDEF